MKKLLTLAILTISLTSCETSEMNYNEPINQTQQNSVNYRDGNSNPLDKDGFIHIVGETDQMFYMGEELYPIRAGEEEDLLNEYDAMGRITVYCSATFSNGHTYQLIEQADGFWDRKYFIKHIYPNGSVQWTYNPTPSYSQCSILKWEAFWS